MGTVEVLAPAGSFEALKAGIRAGADAAYLGGRFFGARAFAENFTDEDLLRAIDYAHVRRKKVYLTVNTLLTDEDVRRRLYQWIEPCYRQGIDAVIVQDVGVLRFLHEHFPDMDVHASTQMTVTTAKGVELLARYGVVRLVPARELSLDEIRCMRAQTKLELEAFVHGALCYSYSGQCHMSAALGGRSGNKGKCAGPCRLRYQHEGEEGHFLSLKDLCSLPLLARLLDAGVQSLKIEGRMKKPEYAALTAHVYRKYADYYEEMGLEGYERWMQENPKEYQDDLRKLKDVYNRGGFTKGYFTGDQVRKGDMLAWERPGHYGVYVGRVVKMKGDRAFIRLEEEIKAGDVLEFRDKHGAAIYEYTVGKDGVPDGMAASNTGRGTGVRVGNAVYRTKNRALLEEVAKDWGKEKKIRVQAALTVQIGEPARLRLQEGDVGVECAGEMVGKADKKPITQEEAWEKLARMGNTPFQCEEVEFAIDEGAFVSLSGLNELRRRACRELEQALAGAWRRERPVVRKSVLREGRRVAKVTEKGLTVSVSSKEQWRAVRREAPKATHVYLCAEELGLGALRQCLDGDGLKYYIRLPHIFREEAYERYRVWWEREGAELSPCLTGFVVSNLAQIHFLENVADKPHGKEWVLNDNMYAKNAQARQFFRENGMDAIEGEPVYGRPPLMVSANCLLRNRKGCTHEKQEQTLTDAKGRKFIVVNQCDSCYNILYAEKPNVPSSWEREAGKSVRIRLDFTLEDESEVEKALRKVGRLFCSL